jgi:ketosteroid isomerase-like protein
MTRTPQDVFERMRQEWLDLAQPDGCLLADDVVLEMPFAADGPKRLEGRDAVMAYISAGRASFPLRFDAVADVTIHQTPDPEVIVVEYVLCGRLPDGSQASAPFVGVLRVRDGRTLVWREYQDKFAIAAALQRAARRHTFGGPEWVAALARLSAQQREAEDLSGVTFRISTEFTGAPDGITGWHLAVVDGAVEAGNGPAAHANMRVRSDYRRHHELTTQIWGDDPAAIAQTRRQQAEAMADGSIAVEGEEPPPALQALIRALHDPTARITA